MVFTEFGTVNDVRSGYENALSPMLVTVLGMVNDYISLFLKVKNMTFKC